MPFAGMSASSCCPIGPSSRLSAVLASRNRNGRSSTCTRGKNDSRNPVVWNAMSTMPVCMPDTMLTSLPSWPPANTWIFTAPPVFAATSSENLVAIACVGCRLVSGWPSLRVTVACAKARPGRPIAGIARAPAAAARRKSLRVMLTVSRRDQDGGPVSAQARFELGERLELDALFPIGRTLVIDARIHVAALADRAEIALLLLFDHRHVRRIRAANNIP